VALHPKKHTHPVGFPWTSDQPLAEAATCENTTNTRDELSGIQRDSNQRSQKSTTADLNLRPHGHRDQNSFYITSMKRVFWGFLFKEQPPKGRRLKIILDGLHKSRCIAVCTMKAYGAERYSCICSLLQHRWRWLLSFTPRPLYQGMKCPVYNCCVKSTQALAS
jgi:hypothetical protein